mgnify:CR=1 FL=1
MSTINPLKLGKIALFTKALTQQKNEESFRALNLYIETLEKIVSANLVYLICKCEKFREMTARDKSIPSYKVMIEWSDIMQTYNVTFEEEINSGTDAKKIG